MIEAMACGTPVVAMRQGSVPEVVDDGETGFVVDPDDLDAIQYSEQELPKPSNDEAESKDKRK
jgi:hypothetical protein